MSQGMSPADVRSLGKNAVEGRESAAVDTLVHLSRTSPMPEIRGIAALFLGVIDWDQRPVAALSRLLADPGFVNLSEHPDFAHTMAGFKMYRDVVPISVAVATLATHTTSQVGVPIRKVAQVALLKRANKMLHNIADPEPLLELLVTGDLPVDPGQPDPIVRAREAFMWREGAARELLLLFRNQVRAEHVPALVAQAAAWYEIVGSNVDVNPAAALLDRRVDLWTVEVVAAPIAVEDKRVRAMVARMLAELAARGDPYTRPYLERLAADGEPSVAKAAAKGLKALGKAERKL